MANKRLTEKELLDDLNADNCHSEDLAQPLPQELSPLERLKGSVKRYELPLDPVWDEYCNSGDCVTDDFMKDRVEPPKGRE